MKLESQGTCHLCCFPGWEREGAPSRGELIPGLRGWTKGLSRKKAIAEIHTKLIEQKWPFNKPRKAKDVLMPPPGTAAPTLWLLEPSHLGCRQAARSSIPPQLTGPQHSLQVSGVEAVSEAEKQMVIGWMLAAWEAQPKKSLWLVPSKELALLKMRYSYFLGYCSY